MDIDQEQRQHRFGRSIHPHQRRHHHHQQQHQIYEPQSIATPDKCATRDEELENIEEGSASATTNSAATAAAVGTASRRRKRRSLFGAAKLSPTSKTAKQQRKSTAAGLLDAGGGSGRRACLTEILWEDVQKAKELLGFRQKATTGASTMASTTVDKQASSGGQPPLQQHPVIAKLMMQSSTSANTTNYSSNNATTTAKGCEYDSQNRIAPIALTESATEDDLLMMDCQTQSPIASAAASICQHQQRTVVASAVTASSTLPRSRSHRHRRASSDLADADAYACAPLPLVLQQPKLLNSQQLPHSLDDSVFNESSFYSHHLLQQPPPSLPPSSARSLTLQHQQQQQRSPQHQQRIARFWELKRLLAELAVRKAEKLAQLAALEAKEKSLSGEFHPKDHTASDHCGSSDSLPRQQQQHQQQQQQPQQQPHQNPDAQLCFPTQYLVAVEEESSPSELVQLQEEAAVQRALVEANARLLRECQTDRAARQLKRKRTQEYQRSQEKLRSLNQRIAEIRARDSANEAAVAAAAAAASCSSFSGSLSNNDDAIIVDAGVDCNNPAGTGSQLQSPILSSAEVSEASAWSQSLPALISASSQANQLQQQQQQQQLANRKLNSFRAFSKPQPPHRRCPNASAVASTVSVDSGFQDISSCCTSSTTSLELNCQAKLTCHLKQLATTGSSAPAAAADAAAAADDEVVNVLDGQHEAMDEDGDF